MSVEGQENDSESSANEPASLKEELAAQFDKQVEESPSGAASSGEQSSPQADGSGEPEAAPDDAAPDDGEAKALEAPEHWDAAKKEAFNNLADLGEHGVAAQQLVLDRVKEADRSANEKFEQAAQARKTQDRFSEVVAPFRQSWAMQGLDEFQGVQQTLAYLAALQRDPNAAIRVIAQQFGATLPETGEAPIDDEFTDPKVAALERRLAETQQVITNLLGGVQQQTTNAKQQEILAFKDEKSPDGKLLHPHLDAVVEDMIVIASGLAAAGKPRVLQDVYDRAVSMNAARLKTVPTKTPEQIKQEKIAAAKRARSAAAGVRTTAPTTPMKSDKPKTQKQELSDLWDAMQKRG